ncbi:sulfite exporter TauE/SafE family protein [Glaesserella parasuis]|nr:sulfite exporter TauE/SafE family protein [Glaesserella parasuis]
MTITTILILITCGILTNLMSALFGIGGGVLMVPILHTLFPEFSLQMVAATSLMTVMGTATINLVYFYKQRVPVKMKSLLLWSIGMIIGVQLGFEISFFIPNWAIVAVFVTTLVVLALCLILAKKSENSTACSSLKENIKGISVCLFGGSVAGITGIGGGSIMAPLISLLPSVKPHQIAAYSNYMMIIGGLGNLYGYLSKIPPVYLENSWQVGYVNFTVVSIVVLCSFLTSFFSMKLRGILKPLTMQRLLSGILLVIAGYMLILQGVRY